MSRVALQGATQAGTIFWEGESRQSGPFGPAMPHPVTAERTDAGYARDVSTQVCLLNGRVPNTERQPEAEQVGEYCYVMGMTLAALFMIPETVLMATPIKALVK